LIRAFQAFGFLVLAPDVRVRIAGDERQNATVLCPGLPANIYRFDGSGVDVDVAVDCDVACPRSSNNNKSEANESEKAAGRWGAIKTRIDDGQLSW